MNALDIKWIDLFLSLLLFIIPIGIFWYYRTGLVVSTLIALARMVAQLVLVGFYLEYIFMLDSIWLNISWVVAMIIIAGYTTTTSSGISTKLFIIPIMLALAGSIVLIDAFFFGFVLKMDYVFEARYFIPISGMLLGNAMKTNVIALNAFFYEIRDKQDRYRYYLACGAKLHEAQRGFIQSGIQKAFNPMIAIMAVMGIIALPGMMTGQILGGSPPMLAIKYQIMLMVTIFVISVMTVFLSLKMSGFFVFDKFDNMKKGVLKKPKKIFMV